MLADSRSSEFNDLITDHILVALQRLRVAQPGRIEKFNSNNLTVNVTPLQRVVVYTGKDSSEWTDLKTIPNVPLLYGFVSNGMRGIDFPIQQGDLVLLVWCDYSLDEWKSGKGQFDPIGRVSPFIRTPHNSADAIAIPGLYIPSLIPNPLPAVIKIDQDGTITLDQGTEHFLRGDTYREAQSTLNTALTAFLTALNSYVVAIKPTADPTNAATPAMTAAITAIKTAISSFESGSYLSRNKVS